MADDGLDATSMMTFWLGPIAGPLTVAAEEMVRRGFSVEQAENIMAVFFLAAQLGDDDGNSDDVPRVRDRDQCLSIPCEGQDSALLQPDVSGPVEE